MKAEISFNEISCNNEFAERLANQLRPSVDVDFLSLLRCWCKIPCFEIVSPEWIVAVVRVLEDENHYVFDTTWFVHMSKDERETIMRRVEELFKDKPACKTIWWIGC